MCARPSGTTVCTPACGYFSAPLFPFPRSWPTIARAWLVVSMFAFTAFLFWSWPLEYVSIHWLPTLAHVCLVQTVAHSLVSVPRSGPTLPMCDWSWLCFHSLVSVPRSWPTLAHVPMVADRFSIHRFLSQAVGHPCPCLTGCEYVSNN